MEELTILKLLRQKFDLSDAFAAAISKACRPEGDGEGDGKKEGEEAEGKEGEKGGEGTGSEGEIKDPEKKRLSDEAAKHRNEKKTAEQERDAALAKLRELEDKDKSESEKNKRDKEEEKAKREKAEAKLKEQAVKLAFFDSGAAALFHDAGDALRLLDLSDLKPDDEGEVDAKLIKQKADQLLKEKPYLAKQEGDDAAHSSGGSGGDQASGRPNNGKKSKDQVDYEALAKKFPALRR